MAVSISNGRSSTGWLMLAAVLLVIVFGLRLAPQVQVPGEAGLTFVWSRQTSVWGVRLNTHALVGHADVAPIIRQCLDNNPPGPDGRNRNVTILRNKQTGRFYLVCQLPDGRWGFQIVVWDKIEQAWEEVNAFLKDADASYTGTLRYLQSSGATNFGGGLRP